MKSQTRRSIAIMTLVTSMPAVALAASSAPVTDVAVTDDASFDAAAASADSEFGGATTAAVDSSATSAATAPSHTGGGTTLTPGSHTNIPTSGGTTNTPTTNTPSTNTPSNTPTTGGGAASGIKGIFGKISTFLSNLLNKLQPILQFLAMMSMFTDGNGGWSFGSGMGGGLGGILGGASNNTNGSSVTGAMGGNTGVGAGSGSGVNAERNSVTVPSNPVGGAGSSGSRVVVSTHNGQPTPMAHGIAANSAPGHTSAMGAGGWHNNPGGAGIRH